MLNTMDRVDAAERAELLAKHQDEAVMVEDVLVLPYARQELIGEVYESARMLSETYDQTGRVLTIRGLPEAIARLRLRVEAH